MQFKILARETGDSIKPNRIKLRNVEMMFSISPAVKVFEN